MAYTLNESQKKNAQILIQRMKDKGITNPYTQSAILAVVSKETEFNPAAAEVSYATTSNDRIRKIFSKTKTLTDAQLDTLKADKKKFFDFVYNGIAGNGPTDGYLFRGRGYNQLTGRGNYTNMAKATGHDLVNNPDLLSDPKVAADVAIAYFMGGYNSLKKTGKNSWYNSTDINDFKNLNDSLGAIYHINAGVGHVKAHIDADVTGGRKKALSRVGDLYTFATGKVAEVAQEVEKKTEEATEVVKKNPLTTILIAAGITVAVVLIIKAVKKK
jgi:predicted chitinase